MSLKAQIEAEIKQSMLNKDKDRLRALRSIKSLILLAETEKGASGELTQDAEMKLLTKAAKQRKDSLEIYEKEGRTDLAEVERSELAVIEGFLPKQMSEEEVTAALKEIIAKVGASGPQDMGKVMGLATKEMAGKADGKLISTITKGILNS
ncbi:MAG: GatB/YqeY domain-containing protein [Bacteroidota bacterium]